MASANQSQGLDMNHDSNLRLYSELFLFKNDRSRDEILWENPEYQIRKALMALVQKLDLEFEYSLETRAVRITHRAPPDTKMNTGICDFDFLNSEQLQDHGCFSGNAFSLSSSHFHTALNASLPVPPSASDGPFDKPVIATETSSMAMDWASPVFVGLSDPNLLDHDYIDFFNKASEFPPVEFQAMNSSINDLSAELYSPRQWSRAQFPVPPAVESTEYTFQPPTSTAYRPYMSIHGCDFKNGHPILDNPSLPSSDLPYQDHGMISKVTKIAHVGVLPTSDLARLAMDENNADYSDNPPKLKRFCCTDYPPCKVSYTRSEHLARHTRKHTGARPFVCYCSRKFSRLDNLRQHAQTVHVNEEIPSDWQMGTRVVSQIRKNKTRPPRFRNRRAADARITASNESRRISPSTTRLAGPERGPTLSLPDLNMPTELPDTPSSMASSISVLSKTALRDERRGTAFPPSSNTLKAELSGRLSRFACHITNPITPVQSRNVVDSNSQQPNSRSGSVSSLRSERGENEFKSLFSRRSSVNSAASSGYQEIVFDSRSAHSGSEVSGASGASGRRGPLDGFAKAAMKAVKAVGACWRCKFLKKSCNAESPCKLCPKGNPWTKSNWKAVGCQRGDLKTQMFPVKLCSHPYELVPRKLLGQPDPYWAANAGLHQNIARRERQIEDSDLQFRTRGTVWLTSNMSWSLAGRTDVTPSAFVPLEECILAIAWEFQDLPLASTILDGRAVMGMIKLLLRSAIYQAKHENDQLIAQSLICLRSCLEALRIKDLGHLGKSSHLACDGETCKIQCLENLKMNLTLYLDELSRVFFKKESRRDRTTWYISMIYSFSIQAYVRRALQKLSADGEAEGMPPPRFATFVHSALTASSSFLHLAIRLFIASCGTWDPLAIDYEFDKDSSSEFCKDIVSLQTALGVSIHSCGGYLKNIFEM